ncbi:MAG: hypothetical protein E7231_10845 [Cellulosilyticum sp.]|nr:hypothetical protein [Cellulosilyticum sp.]
MKRMKQAVLTAGILLGMLGMPMQVQAAEYINLTDYTEIMTPVNGLDGQLEVSVKGEAGEDGYLYIISSVEDMAPTGEVTGENLESSELEAYSEGSVNYFRIKVKDAAQEASVKAQFSCPGFYDVKEKAETNGSAHYPIAYKFTNHLASKIGNYEVMIFVPEGNEIVKVSKPSAYADYILTEENNLRGVGLTKGLASAGNINLEFTFNEPFGSEGISKVIIWVVCLGIGGVVLIDRLKKANKES